MLLLKLSKSKVARFKLNEHGHIKWRFEYPLLDEPLNVGSSDLILTGWSRKPSEVIRDYLCAVGLTPRQAQKVIDWHAAQPA